MHVVYLCSFGRCEIYRMVMFVPTDVEFQPNPISIAQASPATSVVPSPQQLGQLYNPSIPAVGHQFPLWASAGVTPQNVMAAKCNIKLHKLNAAKFKRKLLQNVIELT